MQDRKPKIKSLGLWSAGLAAVVSGVSAALTMAGADAIDPAAQQKIVGWGRSIILALDELVVTGLAIAAAWGRLRASQRLT